MPKNDRPYAVCHADGEPLIGTFEFPQYEFYCQVCKRKYGFLSPSSADPTPELDARYEELRAQYDAERKAREEEKERKAGHNGR